MIVFYGSQHCALTKLQPHKSSHGQAYVYGTKDRILAMLFTVRWNDYMLNVAYGDDGLLEITERYENALEQIFRDRSGWLYVVPAETFESGLTPFEGEVVSRVEVPVLSSRRIGDIYRFLLDAEEKEIRIRRYPDRHPDIPMDDSDLVEEALHLEKQGNKGAIGECLKYHPELKSQFQKLGYPNP